MTPFRLLEAIHVLFLDSLCVLHRARLHEGADGAVQADPLRSGGKEAISEPYMTTVGQGWVQASQTVSSGIVATLLMPDAAGGIVSELSS